MKAKTLGELRATYMQIHEGRPSEQRLQHATNLASPQQLLELAREAWAKGRELVGALETLLGSGATLGQLHDTLELLADCIHDAATAHAARMAAVAQEVRELNRAKGDALDAYTEACGLLSDAIAQEQKRLARIAAERRKPQPWLEKARDYLHAHDTGGPF